MKKSPFAVETAAARKRVLPEFRARALRFGLSRRMKTEDAEDFASSAAIEYLRGGRYELTWLWVDFLRERSGRKGQPGYEARLALERANVSIDDLFGGLPAPTPEEPSRDVRDLIVFIPDERTRRCFQLFLEGYTYAEIGQLVGGRRWVKSSDKRRRGKLERRIVAISEARVCQLIGTGIMRIRRRLGLPREPRRLRQLRA